MRLEIVVLGSQETKVSLEERQDDEAEMSSCYWVSEGFGMKVAS